MGSNSKAQLWETERGQPVGLAMPRPSGAQVVFSRDRKLVGFAPGGGRPQVFTIPEGQLASVPLACGEVTDLCFGGADNSLISLSRDGSLRLFSGSSGQVPPTLQDLDPSLKSPRDANLMFTCFSQDGQELLHYSPPLGPRLWRQSVRGQPTLIEDAPKDPERLSRLLVGKVRAYSWVGGWNLAEGSPALDPSGSREAVIVDEKDVVIESLPEKKLLTKIRPDGFPLWVEFGGGKSLWVCSRASAESRAKDRHLQAFDSSGRPLSPLLAVGYPSARRLSPDGRKLGLFDKQLALVVDVSEATAPKLTSFVTQQCASMAFSWDGTKVALGEDQGAVNIVDVASGRNLLTFTVTGKPRALAFDRNGLWLAVGMENGEFRLFDQTSGRPLSRSLNLGSTIQMLAVSPDGGSLAIGTSMGRICWWKPPLPLTDPAERIGRWAQLWTGEALDLETSRITPLGLEDWKTAKLDQP